jgi:hypothetical protein
MAQVVSIEDISGTKGYPNTPAKAYWNGQIIL